jgi:hypothetical protein
MLQFGGLPQWCPPSHALQWQLQPEPALTSDARIADQLLCRSDHLNEAGAEFILADAYQHMTT